MTEKEDLQLQSNAIPQGLKNFIYNSILTDCTIRQIADITHLETKLIVFIVSESIEEIKKSLQEAK